MAAIWKPENNSRKTRKMNVNGARLVFRSRPTAEVQGRRKMEKRARKRRAYLRDIAEALMQSAWLGIENFGRELFALPFALYFRAANNY